MKVRVKKMEEGKKHYGHLTTDTKKNKKKNRNHSMVGSQLWSRKAQNSADVSKYN